MRRAADVTVRRSYAAGLATAALVIEADAVYLRLSDRTNAAQRSSKQQTPDKRIQNPDSVSSNLTEGTENPRFKGHPCVAGLAARSDSLPLARAGFLTAPGRPIPDRTD